MEKTGDTLAGQGKKRADPAAEEPLGEAGAAAVRSGAAEKKPGRRPRRGGKRAIGDAASGAAAEATSGAAAEATSGAAAEASGAAEAGSGTVAEAGSGAAAEATSGAAAEATSGAAAEATSGAAEAGSGAAEAAISGAAAEATSGAAAEATSGAAAEATSGAAAEAASGAAAEATSGAAEEPLGEAGAAAVRSGAAEKKPGRRPRRGGKRATGDATSGAAEATSGTVAEAGSGAAAEAASGAAAEAASGTVAEAGSGAAAEATSGAAAEAASGTVAEAGSGAAAEATSGAAAEATSGAAEAASGTVAEAGSGAAAEATSGAAEAASGTVAEAAISGAAAEASGAAAEASGAAAEASGAAAEAISGAAAEATSGAAAEAISGAAAEATSGAAAEASGAAAEATSGAGPADLAYIQAQLKIQDKAGRLIPLVFNPLQMQLYAEIQRQRDAGRPVRIIILKARQIGFSTATAALFYQRAATMPNHNGMIVAHKADASTNIFNKSKLFWEMSDPAARPMKKASNAKELLFENPSAKAEEKLRDPGLRSRIVIETAGNKDAGRSATLHDLHLSELAFWPYADQTLISLMQAVPNLPETMVIIESTANGVGGAFYREWRRARAGQSAFVPLFFPWWAHAEYRLADPDFQPTAEELVLADTYGLDLEQLAWRRWCLQTNCGGDANVFAQEYPSNDEEAFLLSGRPVFDMRALARAEQAAPRPRLGRVVESQGRAQFVEDGAYLRLYCPPQDGVEYVIGVDAAEGLATGDWSVMAVVEKATLSLAALWRGHIDPDLLGREAVLLARYYQGAYLAPEANNHGIAVINAIRRENYGRMYRQRDLDTGKLSDRWGFSTTARTKPLAVNLLAKLIREGPERLRDELLIQECMRYAYDDKGHTNAQPGAYDDCVMAMAIAVAVACESHPGPRFQEADWRRLYGACPTTGY